MAAKKDVQHERITKQVSSGLLPGQKDKATKVQKNGTTLYTPTSIVLQVKKEETKELGKLPTLKKKDFSVTDIPLRATALGKSKSFLQQNVTSQKLPGSRRSRFEQMKAMASDTGLPSEKATVPKALSLLGLNQMREGYWMANEETAAILGETLEKILQRIPLDLQNHKHKEIIWMTILVIAWCDHYYNDNYNWESIREKAAEWAQIEDQNYKQHFGFADAFFNIGL